jgi:hypothetical protein
MLLHFTADVLRDRIIARFPKQEHRNLTEYPYETGRNLLLSPRIIGTISSKLGCSVADIVTFGFIVMCMTSACGIIPEWISKIGELGVVIFLLIAILGLLYLDRYED